MNFSPLIFKILSALPAQEQNQLTVILYKLEAAELALKS